MIGRTANCITLLEALNKSKKMYAEYMDLTEKAELQRDFSQVEPMRQELKIQVEALRNLNNPFELELRNDLAINIGAFFIGRFYDGIAIADFSDQKKYIRRNGRPLEINDDNYEPYHNFKQGFATVKMKRPHEHQYNYMDRNGRLLLKEPVHTDFEFNEGKAIIAEEQAEKDKYLYGAIDQQGNAVIPCIFASIGNFSDGVALVAIDDDGDDWNCGMIDSNGNVLLQDADRITDEEKFGEFMRYGRIVVNNNKFTLVNLQGEDLTGEEYEALTPTQNGAMAVKTSTGWKLLDVDGNEIDIKTFKHPCPSPAISYSDNEEYWEEACTILTIKNGKIEEVETDIKLKEFELNPQIYIKTEDGRERLVDNYNRPISDEVYIEVEEMCHGIFAVRKLIDNEWYLIDASGKQISTFGFREINAPFVHGYTIAMIAGYERDQDVVINGESQVISEKNNIKFVNDDDVVLEVWDRKKEEDETFTDTFYYMDPEGNKLF